MSGNREFREKGEKKNLLSRLYRCLGHHPALSGFVGNIFTFVFRNCLCLRARVCVLLLLLFFHTTVLKTIVVFHNSNSKNFTTRNSTKKKATLSHNTLHTTYTYLSSKTHFFIYNIVQKYYIYSTHIHLSHNFITTQDSFFSFS